MNTTLRRLGGAAAALAVLGVVAAGWILPRPSGAAERHEARIVSGPCAFVAGPARTYCRPAHSARTEPKGPPAATGAAVEVGSSAASWAGLALAAVAAAAGRRSR